MTRNPLFREEDNIKQRPHLTTLTSSDQTVHKEILKTGTNDGLWSRMNLGIRLSCQQSKPPLKR